MGLFKLDVCNPGSPISEAVKTGSLTFSPRFLFPLKAIWKSSRLVLLLDSVP